LAVFDEPDAAAFSAHSFALDRNLSTVALDTARVPAAAAFLAGAFAAVCFFFEGALVAAFFGACLDLPAR